jgi:hypothetical protein
VAPVWVLLLGAVLLWPTTRSGYLLGHDMVFTPRQPLDLQAIGVSSAPPRAVPLDALVALAERVVDGAVIGRLALLLPILGAGLGVVALLGAVPLPARLAGATAAVWNPYVVERLALGQWALVWCYAALPWIVLAIARLRGRAGWLARGAAMAAAAITPTGGVIGAVTAIGVTAGLRRPRGQVLATAGLALVLQLPWLVPAAVSTAAATSDPNGVAAFAARAEHPGGVLLSILDGGGIWDSDVMPQSRAGALPWLWLAVLLASAGYGTGRLIALLGKRLVATLAVLSAAGLLVALLPALPGGAALLRAATQHVPGAGLLRDGQKWTLPLVVFEALLVGAAVARLAARARATPWRALLAVAAVAVPLIALPDAAATLRPTLEPVHYPADWSRVAALIDRGDVAVLPWGSYRTFPWAPGRSVLDPAPRLLPAPTVVDDRLAVSGTLLAGEDPHADAVRRALHTGSRLAVSLAAQGVAWVVVEHGTPGDVPELGALSRVYSGRDVSLYRVPAPVREQQPSTVRVAAVLAGDALAVTLLAGLVLVALYARSPRARTRRKARLGEPPPLI